MEMDCQIRCWCSKIMIKVLAAVAPQENSMGENIIDCFLASCHECVITEIFVEHDCRGCGARQPG